MKTKTLSFKTLTLLLFALCFSAASFAQDDEKEEDPACMEKPQNKKVLKLFNQGTDRKKGDEKSRYKALKDALELDEQCGACMWELGKNQYRKAKAKGGEHFKHAVKYYEMLADLCPEWHAEVYYRLGVIEYNRNNDDKALQWFQKYLDFPVDDDSKLGRRYTEQIAEVKSVMPEIKWFRDFYANKVRFDPKLVKNVSSEIEEYLPMISPDNDILMYTRKYDYKAKGDVITKTIEELTMSERQTWTSPFTSGAKMPPPFNTNKYSRYGGVSISIDNKEMYVCACKNAEGYMNCDLFVTNYTKVYDEVKKKEVYKWSELKNLGPNINSPKSWEAQPSISADGKTLFFATSRKDCYKRNDGSGAGTMDIYYSERQDDGSWGLAKNLGPTINSHGHDKAPFMHSDSRTLYFVSETGLRRWGAGGFDIFYTRQNKETGEWSKPENIGFPINSNGDEEGIIVSADGTTAYFSSSRSGGAGMRDIYTFEMPKKARPDQVIIYKGKVKSDDGSKMDDVEIEVALEGTDQVTKAPAKVSENGEVVAFLNVGKQDEPKKDILVTVKKEGYAFESKLIKKEDIKPSQPIVKKEEMKVTELKAGMSYTINDILYKVNSAELDPRSRIVLDGFARFLKENSTVKIEIQGHTDDVGNDAANMALSQDRAFTVFEYLNGKGIKASRLKFKGFGETKPKVPNSNDKNRAENRRTDFKILSL